MFNLFQRKKPPQTQNQTPSSETHAFDAYTVVVSREPRRRGVSVQVNLNGRVQVRASKTTSVREIFKFLDQNRAWIEKQSQKFARIRNQNPPKQYVAGETFPFMGELKRLHFIETPAASGQISCSHDLLTVALPRAHFARLQPAVPQAQLAKPLREYYQHNGRAYIEKRLGTLSKQMKLFPKNISYRSQKTRWGSCSSRGHISFNWRLIVMPPAVIDYVIVHELAHLQHPNHSKNFWRLVAQHDPEYRVHRKYLRDNQFAADFLGNQSELWNSPHAPSLP